MARARAPHGRDRQSASYPDELDIHTSITEWRGKSFVQTHKVMRGEDLIMECKEVRVFAMRQGSGIRAVVPPQEVLERCMG